MIRYYGWLSNRSRSKLLKVVYQVLNCPVKEIKPAISWRELLLASFGTDPLQCPHCKKTLLFQSFYFAMDSPNFLTLHQVVATQECPQQQQELQTC